MTGAKTAMEPERRNYTQVGLGESSDDEVAEEELVTFESADGGEMNLCELARRKGVCKDAHAKRTPEPPQRV